MAQENPPQVLQLDQPPASAAGSGAPPQTLQIDQPSTTPSGAPTPTELPNSVFGNADTNSTLGNLVAGFSKEANKTAQGAIDLVNKGNRALAGGAGGDVPSLPVVQAGENLNTKGTAQGIGGGVENIAEFAAGDEALSGLARAAKIVELGDKYPIIKRTLDLAKAHPVIAKMIGESAKAATVGGVQGAAKGAAEGDAAGGAKTGVEGGAIGGAVGAAAGELASAVIKPFAEKLGIGTTAGADATVAARPSKRNYNFVRDFEAVAPRIDAAENALDATGAKNPSKSMEDWADTIKQARESLYQGEVQPLLDQYGARPLSGIEIKNRITADIPQTLKDVSPEKAAQVEQFAQQFMPGQRFNLTANDAERYIQHFNAELNTSGYYKLDPSARAALEKVNPDIIQWKSAADAIRDELYSKLGDWQVAEHVQNPVDVAKLKRDYGSLRNIENEVRGRINVNNRQSPLSLKETIGLVTGLAHGGPVGVAMAGIPIADRMLNSPERVFARAVQKGAHPEQLGAGVRVGQAVKAAAPSGGMIGAEAPRLFWTASDGSEHSSDAHPDAPAMVHQVDPGAKFHGPSQQ